MSESQARFAVSSARANTLLDGILRKLDALALFKAPEDRDDESS